ncbi:divalent metal cation transporter [Dokdonella sp.]|uniref:NRAMP family divalent metal transporter n=1 Tax=Dokdonella sp. TaxID=2291710 RepID=UPI002F3EB940
MAPRDDRHAAPPSTLRAAWARIKRHPLSRVGPGLITGVADDDPSGIATYSQAGAQFGFAMLWTMPVAFPLMAAIQSMCARIGRVTGRGLAANIKAAFPAPILHAAVVLLLVANVLNIAADVAAMGEVAELVTGLDRHAMTTVFVVATVLLQVFVPYHRYVSFLKWLTLSLLAYAAVLFVVHVPWREVVARTAWPRLALDSAAATMVVGLFGTTISPYLFFWQASEEVEDLRRDGTSDALVRDGAAAGEELRRIRWDTWSGMFYSNVTAYFIILATAVTLHAAGVTHIDTAAQAASALQPLAGRFAFVLFSLGILGVGLIGVPVLAGSAAYALCESMGWTWGLERKAEDARAFYAIIAVSVCAGLVIQFLPIDPMRALFWSAVINGVIAVPLMAIVILLASNKTVMGAYTASRPVVALGWLATAIMAAAAVRMWMPD